MLDKDTFKEIGEIFIGDKGSSYNYKKGPDIYKFFNKYFNYNDKYLWGQPQLSRWMMVTNKLIDIDNNGNINKFFSIILSNQYLQVEYPDLANDELAEKSIMILNSFNSKLKKDELILIKTSNGVRLMDINDDLEYLGAGGFAVVYKIKSRNIVLKKLKEENYIDKGIVSRFKREYEITKKLSYLQGVINVLEYDEKDISYTMELAEMDLEKYITKNELSNDNKIIIIYQILSVMKEVHQMDIIHRDISPNNILLFNGLFKMSDFGLGKDLSIFNSHQTNKTNSYGQFFYCDPKQFMKLKDGDKISDIYSIGKLINFIMTKDPNNMDHQYKGVSEKATAMNELARYKSIKEMKEAIDSVNKILQNKNYEQEVLRKISNGDIDETVIAFINTLDSNKLFWHLQDSGFRNIFEQMIQNYENSEKLYNRISMLYQEMQNTNNKRYEHYDAIGLMALFIIEGKFEFFVKEAAVDILNHIIGLNRFDIIRRVVKMIKNGVDQLLEEKFNIPSTYKDI